MIVAVGSKNKTKVQPVEEVFAHHFKDVTVIDIYVPSGVSEQPMSEDEMFRGALNRAKESIKKVKDADYGVGIEGGLHKQSYGWFEKSLVVIIDKKGEIGIGSSGGIVLPEKIMKHIYEGKNITQAIESIYGIKNIGEGIGMFGLMTKEIVTRSSGVKHGVAFALARFLHKDLYS